MTLTTGSIKKEFSTNIPQSRLGAYQFPILWSFKRKENIQTLRFFKWLLSKEALKDVFLNSPNC